MVIGGNRAPGRVVVVVGELVDVVVGSGVSLVSGPVVGARAPVPAALGASSGERVRNTPSAARNMSPAARAAADSGSIVGRDGPNNRRIRSTGETPPQTGCGFEHEPAGKANGTTLRI